MITVQVTFSIKENEINNFIEVTKYNVENSRRENGVLLFNFYKVEASDNNFILFESYKSKEDQDLHRTTEHYKKWKNETANMLNRPYGIEQLNLIE